MNILLLCAGLGTRLRPLTNTIPKALVKVGKKSVLEWHIDHLPKGKLFLNAHYEAEALFAFAEKEESIAKVFYEEELLGTGGPLAQVFQDGFDEDLLVVNSDLVHTFDLEAFCAFAQGKDSLSLLALDKGSKNTLLLKKERLTGIQNVFELSKPDSSLAFSGISYYPKDVLKNIALDCFDIRSFWKNEIAKGKAPYVFEQNATWFDMGTPQGLYDTVSFLEGSLENGMNLSESPLELKPHQIYYDAPKDDFVGKGIVIGDTFWKL